MKEQEDFNLTPEDSWTQAKELLDRHYRRRRRMLWLAVFMAGLVALSGGYFFFGRQVKIENSLAVTTSTYSPASESSLSGPPVASADRSVGADVHDPKRVSSLMNSTGKIASGGNAVNVKPANAIEKRSAENSRPVLQDDDVPSSVSKEVGPAVSKKSDLSVIPLENAKPGLDRDADAITVAAAVPDKHNEPSSLVKTELEIQGADTVVSVSDEATVLHSQPDSLPLSIGSAGQSEVKGVAAAVSDSSKTGRISWFVSGYGGVFLVDKTLESDFQTWAGVRNSQENNGVRYAAGVNLSMLMHNWSVGAGVELYSLGEDNDYTPYNDQNFITDSSYWHTYYYTAVDTDTSYIWGNQYFMQTPVQVVDSNYVTDHDTTVQSAYNSAIAAANGGTYFTYLAIPVEVGYQFTKGRFGFGLTAGASPVWLKQTRGSYISRDLSGSVSVEDAGDLNRFFLDVRLGAQVTYSVSSRIGLFVRPQWRQTLGSVYSESSGINQRYSSFGGLFGIRYRLR